MMAFNDLATQRQRLHSEIDAAIQRVLDHGQFIMGPEVAALEQALTQRSGRRHAIAVASGTTALELALRALDIGAGDEVITTAFTWIATANAIALTGATPVFVDIRPDGSDLIDPDAIVRALTTRTKAIIPVGIFGQMPELDRIAALAPGIPIIEDAAQSFGATRHGRPSGGGDALMGCTSFFPSKPLGCYGDGGAILVDDDALADRLRALRTHGGLKRHHHTVVGTNGRLDTLQAAILLAKLPTFDAELDARRRAAAWYDRHLPRHLERPLILPGNTCVFAQYTVRGQEAGWDRDRVAAHLQANGIPTAVYYPVPCHRQPSMAPLCRIPAIGLPATEAACARVLSLPFHPWLSEDDCCRIANVLAAAPCAS